MKKFGMGFLAVMLVVVLAGCTGGKTLTCTMEEEDYMSGTVKIQFDGNDKATGYNMTTMMDLGVELGDEYLDEMCADYTDIDGISCKASADGTEITMILDVDFEKAGDEFADSFGDLTAGYDAVKEEAEADGYTCK